MPELASLLNQAAVRDAICALLKGFLESPTGLTDEFVEWELRTTVVPALGELPGVTIDERSSGLVVRS